MDMKLKSFVASLAVVVAMGLSTQDARAATLVPCNTNVGDVTTNVTPTSSCFGIKDLSDGDAAKLADLNALDINGTTGGWTSLGKFQNTGTNANFSVDDSVVSNKQGKWEIFNAATSVYGEFMMVFKAGQDRNTDPAAFVGYILSAASGDWLSPLMDNSDGSLRDLSNVELFARGDPSVIPLPAAVWLLLGGLGGLAALRRRRKAA